MENINQTCLKFGQKFEYSYFPTFMKTRKIIMRKNQMKTFWEKYIYKSDFVAQFAPILPSFWVNENLLQR